MLGNMVQDYKTDIVNHKVAFNFQITEYVKN